MTHYQAGRRGNNEGSIYQRKSDDRWCGSVTIGYRTDGKPICKTVCGNSRQEVTKQITVLTGEVYEYGYISVSAQKERNFKILFEKWFELFTDPTLASTTIESRHNLMKNHLFKEFGTLDIKYVDLEQLQRFFNGKIRGSMSAM